VLYQENTFFEIFHFERAIEISSVEHSWRWFQAIDSILEE